MQGGDTSLHDLRGFEFSRVFSFYETASSSSLDFRVDVFQCLLSAVFRRG